MIQSLQNPFRDWNVTDFVMLPEGNRFKASKTLLGIETILSQAAGGRAVRFKASKTLLGIETHQRQKISQQMSKDSKPPKPF